MIPVENSRVSSLFESRVPEFIRDNYPLFIAFMTAYYEWLEQSGPASLTDLEKSSILLALENNTTSALTERQRTKTQESIRDWVVDNGTEITEDHILAIQASIGNDVLTAELSFEDKWLVKSAIENCKYVAQPTSLVGNLNNIQNIETSFGKFVDYFEYEFLQGFPKQLAINPETGASLDKATLLKNIKQFYRAKGTEKSFQLLFRILYDADVDFYYPHTDILNLSDGKWTQDMSIHVGIQPGSKLYESINQTITQVDENNNYLASATVTQISTTQFDVSELFLTNVYGSFVSGLPIQYTDKDGVVHNNTVVISSVTGIIIHPGYGGAGHIVGEEVTLTTKEGDTGKSAKAVIAQVDSNGSIEKIQLTNVGFGYTVPPVITFKTTTKEQYAVDRLTDANSTRFYRSEKEDIKKQISGQYDTKFIDTNPLYGLVGKIEDVLTRYTEVDPTKRTLLINAVKANPIDSSLLSSTSDINTVVDKIEAATPLTTSEHDRVLAALRGKETEPYPPLMTQDLRNSIVGRFDTGDINSLSDAEKTVLTDAIATTSPWETYNPVLLESVVEGKVSSQLNLSEKRMLISAIKRDSVLTDTQKNTIVGHLELDSMNLTDSGSPDYLSHDHKAKFADAINASTTLTADEKAYFIKCVTNDLISPVTDTEIAKMLEVVAHVPNEGFAADRLKAAIINNTTATTLKGPGCIPWKNNPYYSASAINVMPTLATYSERQALMDAADQLVERATDERLNFSEDDATLIKNALAVTGQINFTLSTATGTFVAGEKVVQFTTGASGVVASYNGTTKALVIDYTKTGWDASDISQIASSDGSVTATGTPTSVGTYPTGIYGVGISLRWRFYNYCKDYLIGEELYNKTVRWTSKWFNKKRVSATDPVGGGGLIRYMWQNNALYTIDADSYPVSGTYPTTHPLNPGTVASPFVGLPIRSSSGTANIIMQQTKGLGGTLPTNLSFSDALGNFCIEIWNIVSQKRIKGFTNSRTADDLTTDSSAISTLARLYRNLFEPIQGDKELFYTHLTNSTTLTAEEKARFRRMMELDAMVGLTEEHLLKIADVLRLAPTSIIANSYKIYFSGLLLTDLSASNDALTVKDALTTAISSASLPLEQGTVLADAFNNDRIQWLSPWDIKVLRQIINDSSVSESEKSIYLYAIDLGAPTTILTPTQIEAFNTTILPAATIDTVTNAAVKSICTSLVTEGGQSLPTNEHLMFNNWVIGLTPATFTETQAVRFSGRLWTYNPIQYAVDDTETYNRLCAVIIDSSLSTTDKDKFKNAINPLTGTALSYRDRAILSKLIRFYEPGIARRNAWYDAIALNTASSLATLSDSDKINIGLLLSQSAVGFLTNEYGAVIDAIQKNKLYRLCSDQRTRLSKLVTLDDELSGEDKSALITKIDDTPTVAFTTSEITNILRILTSYPVNPFPSDMSHICNAIDGAEIRKIEDKNELFKTAVMTNVLTFDNKYDAAELSEYIIKDNSELSDTQKSTYVSWITAGLAPSIEEGIGLLEDEKRILSLSIHANDLSAVHTSQLTRAAGVVNTSDILTDGEKIVFASALSNDGTSLLANLSSQEKNFLVEILQDSTVASPTDSQWMMNSIDAYDPDDCVVTLLGTTPVANAEIGTLCVYDGYFLNNDGKSSSNKVLQDNYYYQNFSYVLKSEISFNKYKEFVKRLVHPAGFIFFGQTSISRSAKCPIVHDLIHTTIVTPVIGNYLPYTVETVTNLGDTGNPAFPLGYDPDEHDPIIAANGGNPAIASLASVAPDASDITAALSDPNHILNWKIEVNPNVRLNGYTNTIPFGDIVIADFLKFVL